MERAVVVGTPGKRFAENTTKGSVKVWAKTGETSVCTRTAPLSGAGSAPTFMRRILRRNVPSVRIERSWKRKKIAGLRCSSNKRHALADNGPTNVLVYEWRARGAEEPLAFGGLGGYGEV